MAALDTRLDPSVESIETWIVEELASRLEVPASEIDVDQYFDEFDLDPTAAPIPARTLENRLGFELDADATWCHPTIAWLARHIAAEMAKRDDRALS